MYYFQLKFRKINFFYSFLTEIKFLKTFSDIQADINRKFLKNFQNFLELKVNFFFCFKKSVFEISKILFHYTWAKSGQKNFFQLFFQFFENFPAFVVRPKNTKTKE